MSDAEVIQLVLQGDRNKFRILVERYQPMVFRTCMGFLHHKEDADDLSQEVFIQAYLALPKFKGDALFSTWLYRIAVNASLNKTRKSSKQIILQRLEGIFGGGKQKAPELPDFEDPESAMVRDEHRAWVQKALDSLPENQRTAIVLSKYDDLSQREIASVMNITEGAVEALLQRAKANLRKKMSSFRNKP